MTDSVTKKAYARGVGEYLQRHGAIRVPNEQMLKEACDQASGLISVEPAFEGVPHADVEKLAQVLIQFGDQLASQGKVASDPSSISLGRNVRTAVGDLIEKLAADVMNSPHADPPANKPSTITGKGPKSNSVGDSQNAEAKLDDHRKSKEYANVGPGGANFSEPQSARIGTEEKHPMAPEGVGGASGNSVTQASKAASIRDRLRKLAAGAMDSPHSQPKGEPPYGSTIVGSDPNQQNLESDSANAEAMMDVADRPENYANVGQGNAGIQDVPTSAEIGSEADHPKQPADMGGASSNSATEASAKSARWNRHFEETARELGPHLPENMPMDQKVAAVKQAMAMEPAEQQRFIEKIAQEYAPPRDNIGNILSSLGQLSRG